MKYLLNNLSKIEEKLRSSEGVIIMLDFDGTLSPIAPTPYQAILPKSIKSLLSKCSKLFPIVIISGRSLKDIKTRVGLKDLVYAGNHGLEWQIGKKINCLPVSKEVVSSLLSIKKSVKKILRIYPGVLLEDKHPSLAIHYRQLDSSLLASFKKDIDKITRLSSNKNILQVLRGKKVIELRPNLNWNKGKFALFICKYFQNKLRLKLLPMYVGDDKTDEDVFCAFDKDITVRVGQSKTSDAKYYLKNVVQIKLFLKWFVATKFNKQ
ncbi:MAG: hypothetical protein ACD_57C00402G0004 [uncultured bacterium]|nr:MAG: hypothetical protein ACD_57C00402G0004 [uncultured bacterium]